MKSLRSLCALLLLGSPVHAQPAASPSPAESLYAEGVGLFKAGKFEEAAERFQQAYNIDPSPILLYNLARAAEELGRAKAAVGHYKAYITRFPEAPDRTEVERRIRTLEAVLKATQVKPEPKPEPEPEPKPEPEPEPKPDPEPEPAGGLSAMQVGGWTGVGLGVLAVGAGTIFYAQTFGHADDYNTAREDLAAARSGADREDAATRKDDAEEAHSSAGTLAYVFWGVGLAAAAGGATLLLLDEGDTSATLLPTPGGLGLVGTF